MGLFDKEVELIPPKKQTNKTIKVQSLNGYDAIEKIDEGNTMTVKAPVSGKGPQQEKPKTKVSIGL